MANAKHSNGRLFRIHTGSPGQTNKAIFSRIAGCDRRSNQQAGGDLHRRPQQKSRSNSKELLQPFFRNKKSQAPYLQTLVVSLV